MTAIRTSIVLCLCTAAAAFTFGCSSDEGGGPLFPNGTWTTYTFNTPTGNDVSGGVTLQLKADCGANAGCTVDAYIDNVSVTVP